jgi:hypothetical protein
MKHPERLQRRVLARKKCESVQIISVALQMAMSGVMVTAPHHFYARNRVRRAECARGGRML